MDETITCIASFIAKDDLVDKLRMVLNSLVGPTRREEGCLSYVVHQGIDDSRLFTVIEKFRNRSSFEFHGQQPYLTSFKETVGELVTHVSVNLYKSVES